MIFKRADQSSIIDEILKNSAVKKPSEFKLKYSWEKILKTFKNQVLESIEKTDPKNIKDDAEHYVNNTDNIHPSSLENVFTKYRIFDGPVSYIKSYLKKELEKVAKQYQQEIEDYFSQDYLDFPPGHPKTIIFTFKKPNIEPVLKIIEFEPIAEDAITRFEQEFPPIEE